MGDECLEIDVAADEKDAVFWSVVSPGEAADILAAVLSDLFARPQDVMT